MVKTNYVKTEETSRKVQEQHIDYLNEWLQQNDINGSDAQITIYNNHLITLTVFVDHTLPVNELSRGYDLESINVMNGIAVYELEP